ncbi:MAG: polyprenyl synthetase family protein [Halanaerobiales bacterium]|nr:polyprenyl synthetase family protein [Bacillota bacterium]HOA41110.1 polyprenyl synthetase family protein [Halanaerobiales bacterium]HPZ63387.1 polyprenyl synthetase family protein [Halanaerobiales bacterium]HQD03927.1 polyprenyl synthetase family protein [Halanaerobiales bacterium]
MQDFEKKLQEYIRDVEKDLSLLFEDKDLYLSETLLDSIKYSLFSGGKRLRPVLSRAVAEMLDGDVASARMAGAAIEMIHTYSLIHDDLPSMDNDNYRRGKLTNHRVYGSAVAILAGDGLLTYAFNVLSRLPLAPEKTLKIIELISVSAGVQGMVGGQVLDLEAENKEIGLEEMKKIHRAKTGALFRAAILSGAYCSEIGREDLLALDRFAEKLGLTFQIVDDILDVVGDEEKLGKETGSDAKENKATYPVLLGLEEAKKEAEKTAREAREELKNFGEKASFLLELMDFIVVRQF